MSPEGKRRIVLGGVRIIVIAPVVFAFSIPLIMLFHSLLPMYLGFAAAGIVLSSGVVEVGRGVLANRAAKRALPEARSIE